MSLSAGVRLGAFEVVGSLGAGGMGEVYRARDAKLGREVALKILPDAFASDPERLARFEREARTLASLNHPYIAQIYGLEDSGTTRALVMELVEGPTLAERIGSTPLPVEDVLAIASQVVDALDAAHEQGVVHRDLKPANVKVRPDGTVKVLDFGLAKLAPVGRDFSPARGAGPEGPAYVPLSQSPTITSPALLTGAGMILGTAAYMSPEQAKGREADARSDVLAFGVVLFEMLTGRRAFIGEDVAETLVFVMTKEPAWDALPASTPQALRRLLRKCLERTPAKRLRHIADARFDLADAAAEKDAPATGHPAPPHVVGRSFTVRHGILAGGLALLAAIASVAATLYLGPEAVPSPEVRFEIPALGTTAFMSLSPDGRTVAYADNTSTSSGPRLWVRSLDTLEARVLPGTEFANIPDWSPDSREIVFSTTDLKLKKIVVAGGRPQTLTTIERGNYQRATWNQEGIIVYSNGGRLFRVSAEGGESVEIAKPDDAQEETLLSTPWFLPDGRRFFYVAWSPNPDKRFIYVASLDSTERTRLMPSEGKVQYVPGYLVYVRNGALMARSFDPTTLEFTGEAVPLVEEVSYVENSGLAAFYAAESGALIYRKPVVTDSDATRELVWLSRSGARSDRLGAPINANHVTLSSDGSRVASHEAIGAGGLVDVSVYEIARNVRSRLTTGAGFDGFAVWSPDGAELVYASGPGGGQGWGLLKQVSSGAGGEVRVLEAEGRALVRPDDWSAAARGILFERSMPGPGVQRDLWVLSTIPGETAKPYLATPFDEGQGAFSPNGRFVAYTSNESGTYEVFVRPYPDASAGRWQISTSRGQAPRWRRDGKELYFVGGDNGIHAVAVVTEGEFRVGATTPLFNTGNRFAFLNPTVRPYDVTADGQRFLVSQPIATQRTETTLTQPIAVLLNWTSRLRK